MAKEYDNERYKLIDTETGEFVDVEINLLEMEKGDSYRTKAQNDYYYAHTKNFKKGCGFVKLYQDAIEKLTYRFKNNDKIISTIVKLSQYVYYDHTLRCDGKFASISAIAKKIGEDRGNFNRVFNILINEGIIAKTSIGQIFGSKDDKKTVYIVNPNIFYMGQDPLTVVVDMFKHSGW